MTKADQMTSNTIDAICANPEVSDVFKAGLRAAKKILMEMQSFTGDIEGTLQGVCPRCGHASPTIPAHWRTDL